jgi:hypothetical protein
MSGMRVN